MKLWLTTLALSASALSLAGDGIFGTKSSPMPAVDSQSSVGVFPVIQMVVALIFVLALVKWVMPSALKKFGKRSAHTSGPGIRVEETATIGPASLSVVSVRGRLLLVGATADHVTCLADLTPVAPEPQTFQEILESAPADEQSATNSGSLTDLAGQLERLRRIGA